MTTMMKKNNRIYVIETKLLNVNKLYIGFLEFLLFVLVVYIMTHTTPCVCVLTNWKMRRQCLCAIIHAQSVLKKTPPFFRHINRMAEI